MGRCSRDKMSVNLESQSAQHMHHLSQAFANMISQDTARLNIHTKDGYICLISRDLLRFTSPLINSILNDVPSCIGSGIILPDVGKEYVDQFINIIGCGFTKTYCLSIEQVEQVMDMARMLQIDLTELTTLMDPLNTNEAQ